MTPARVVDDKNLLLPRCLTTYRDLTADGCGCIETDFPSTLMQTAFSTTLLTSLWYNRARRMASSAEPRILDPRIQVAWASREYSLFALAQSLSKGSEQISRREEEEEEEEEHEVY